MVQLEHKQTVILGFGYGGQDKGKDIFQNDIWQLKFVDMTNEWQQITCEGDIPQKRQNMGVAIQQDQDILQIHGGKEQNKQLADA